VTPVKAPITRGTADAGHPVAEKNAHASRRDPASIAGGMAFCVEDAVIDRAFDRIAARFGA
jgi:hypothetical protein